MVIKRVISNSFYCLIGIDPTLAPTDQHGNQLVINLDQCLLDTGGMLHMRIPWKDFEIDGVSFAIQPHNAERAVRLIEDTRVDHDDYTAFKMWNHQVYLKPDLCDILLERLKEMATSMEAVHAELDAHQDIMGLESDTLDFISFKGRTPQEIEERLREMGF